MSRRRLFGSLCGFIFFINLARIVFAPLLDVFITEFGINEATAGLIITLTWVGSASLRLPAGWLLTRWPRHYLIIISGAILSVSGVATGTATTVRQLMIGAFFMGSASGVYFVSANPFVTELFPEQVGRVMGIHGAASQIAAVLAAPLVTLTVVTAWQHTFFIIAIGVAVITVYTAFQSYHLEIPNAGSDDRSFLSGARSEWKVVLAALGLAGGGLFVWQGVFNFYELYMQSQNLSGAQSSIMLTIVFISGIPGFFVSGKLADHFPFVPLILSIIATFTGSILLLVATDDFITLAATSVIVGFTIHALLTVTDAYILSTLPDSARGSAYAVFSFMWMLLQSGGSSVVGSLVEYGYSYNTVFTAGALFLIISIIPLVVIEQMGKMPS
jgi:predicted MFS family arabinose efflux permease